MQTQPQYGNWIPKKFSRSLWLCPLLFLVLLFINKFIGNNIYLNLIFAVSLFLSFFYALYIRRCHKIFSYEKGSLTRAIFQFVMDTLPWDGKGTILNIGCASGALAIMCARQFRGSRVIGMDIWHAKWGFSQKLCEENARLEGFSNVRFEKGSPSHLPFEDEAFEAVITNFGFHKFRSEKHKQQMLMESLRVIKKGGSFAFQDFFENRHCYGNMNDLIRLLKAAGISEVHYIPHTENLPFIPSFVKTPLMLNNMGILYGIK